MREAKQEAWMYAVHSDPQYSSGSVLLTPTVTRTPKAILGLQGYIVGEGSHEGMFSMEKKLAIPGRTSQTWKVWG
jgi:hypothetical protein